jgi:hypothetical protein
MAIFTATADTGSAHVGGASINTGKSKVIAVALGVSDSIVAIGDLDTPVAWPTNTSVSISMPMGFYATQAR